MQNFHTISKTFEPCIQVKHPTTNEFINYTSQCHPTCFNNEISTCCLVMFAWSRRCDKSTNQYTYHMDRQHIIHIFYKPVGSCIITVYQYENKSFLQRILQIKIALQQQSVQKVKKWTYFHFFFKERQRRC